MLCCLRIEEGIPGYHRIDLEGYWLLYETVAQDQVTGDNDMLGFDSDRLIDIPSHIVELSRN